MKPLKTSVSNTEKTPLRHVLSATGFILATTAAINPCNYKVPF